MMDYNIIQIIDVELDEREVRLYIPKTIRLSDIQAVSPLTTSRGKLLKSTAVIETYGDKMYIVVGNYKDHINNIKKGNTIGFKR